METGRLDLRPVGAGCFGKYIHQDVLGSERLTELFSVLPAFTRSSGLDWNKDVLSTSDSTTVYIASPDSQHQPQTLACLQAGMHVLTEKPVGPDFALVAAAAAQADRVLMVGFQRRFDPEFARLKVRIAAGGFANGPPARLVVESYDPVPADPNMDFVWRNSCCHDVDMLSWLFPDTSIQFNAEGCVVDPTMSTIKISGTITHNISTHERAADGASTAKKHKPAAAFTTAFLIDYRKAHGSYVQRIVADGVCYGYDYGPVDVPSGEGVYPALGGCATVYQKAYENQFKEFHAQVTRLGSGSGLGGCGGSKAGMVGTTAAAEAERQKVQAAGYARTFELLEAAAKCLRLGPGYQ